ncbi:MAG: hypothetical protein JJU37_02135 [Balneolaceae bacterium]|nr:hypothetical protein [Balneolaceae bacterium]
MALFAFMSINPEDLYFPLDDVTIKRVDEPKNIDAPNFTNSWMAINENEFRMEVENVGKFYAGYGNIVQFAPGPDATPSSLELYLNGSVYGAILHQRKTLPIHGSSFIFNDKGVLLCGESGAGKSSLTAAFCIHGAEFLTDDVTPFQFEDEKPLIIPRSDRVKLWEDSLTQLSENKGDLNKIRPEDEKYYFPIKQSSHKYYPLHFVFIIRLKDAGSVEFIPVSKTEAFTSLYSEIYRLHYLHSMPVLKQNYLKKIASICNHSAITIVNRPAEISIKKMHDALSGYICKPNIKQY